MALMYCSILSAKVLTTNRRNVKNVDICYKCHRNHRGKECNEEMVKKCIDPVKEKSRQSKTRRRLCHI